MAPSPRNLASVPSSTSSPSRGSQLERPSFHVLSVDVNGRTQLVARPSDTQGPSWISPETFESANAPSSVEGSTASDLLLSGQEWAHLKGTQNSQELERVVRHAVSLESLRELERAEYLHQLEQAKSKISHLESQLESLPAFYQSSSALEIARLRGDNDQLNRQAIALARKASAVRPLDLGTEAENASEEMRQENRKLLADVRHLKSRLASTESENVLLTAELRRLRPFYLQGSPLVVQDVQIVLPPDTAHRPGTRAVLLGDAEAELLLQAGKSQSHVRRIQRIPLDKAIQDQAEEIVQAKVPLPVDPPHSNLRSQVRQAPRQPVLPTPCGPSGGLSNYQLPVPPSLQTRMPEPSAALDGEDVKMTNTEPHALGSSPGVRATFEGSESPVLPPAIPGSDSPAPRRRSASLAGIVPLNADAPADSLRQPAHDTNLEEARCGTVVEKGTIGAHGLFGLPTVAPVTSLAAAPKSPIAREAPVLHDQVVASRSPADSAAPELGRDKVVASRRSGGKPIGIGRTPSALDLLSEAAGSMRSTNETPSLNPRSRKPKIDANGAKKARSPYIKWNIEEDEQLLRAVIECGCAWDSVAKLCPTRAYHQVRQRFLRGLRSGETLPPELMYLQSAVRKSVTDYESRRKRRRPARQTSTDGQEDQDPLLANYDAHSDRQNHGTEYDEGDAMEDDQ